MRIGFGVLRLTPDAFWRMTPYEFACALKALSPNAAPLDAGTLDHLMNRYPDHDKSKISPNSKEDKDNAGGGISI